jgi:class 3 adenylate cyclase
VDSAQTRYAKTADGLHIAYQVIGSGPVDMIYVPPHVSHVEMGWEWPAVARTYRALASFSRLLLFDKRGTGMSDRVSDDRLPDLDTRMDDVRAVMDAAGSERAVIVGVSDGAPMSMIFAATYPERTLALVVIGGFARARWATDYPWGVPSDEVEQQLRDFEQWGSIELGREFAEGTAPTEAANPEFVDWFTMLLRRAASPGAAIALWRMTFTIDVRPALTTIRVPTLVVFRSDEGFAPDGRFIAANIPGAVTVELPGADHMPWSGDSERIVREVDAFVSSVKEEVALDRVLATVLFTDIVKSTELAATLGDHQWSQLLGEHHRLVRSLLARYRGREIDTAGDGFLATFDGPARAIRCACAIARSVRDLGLEVRAGIHTGECEFQDGMLRGIAVHTGARIAALAAPGDVVVSRTVKDLVVGSGIAFTDGGEHELRGVPGRWRLFRVNEALPSHPARVGLSE